MVDIRLHIWGMPIHCYEPILFQCLFCLLRECRVVQEVAQIAQWEDEQIEYIKEKVSEEGKQEDIKKGKAPAQVSQVA